MWPYAPMSLSSRAYDQACVVAFAPLRGRNLRTIVLLPCSPACVYVRAKLGDILLEAAESWRVRFSRLNMQSGSLRCNFPHGRSIRNLGDPCQVRGAPTSVWCPPFVLTADKSLEVVRQPAFPLPMSHFGPPSGRSLARALGPQGAEFQIAALAPKRTKKRKPGVV
jgi:hypothetical protein